MGSFFLAKIIILPLLHATTIFPRAHLRHYTTLRPSTHPFSLNKNEFDAQVADCIELIVQHDIADLHPNQLQQIIRCVNTIEKWNLLSSNNKKLLGLSEDLFLQNRINKVQENTNGYYPMLNLEFKSNLNPHSYYLVE